MINRYILICAIFLLFGLSLTGNAIQEASTSMSISIMSGAEEITIYIPVLLDKNNNVMKMYDTATIEGNLITTIIDTEHGKAFKISGPGLGKYIFNWNDVPGKDTDRFVKWMEENLRIKRPDIKKVDDVIIASGKYEVMPSINVVYTFRLNEEKNKILYDVTGTDEYCPLFVKEENGKLNVYTGIVEINMNEKHGIIENKEEFIKGFAISMSNYTFPGNYTSYTQLIPSTFDARIYSNREIERFSFYIICDPADYDDRRGLIIHTIDGNLSRGWQKIKIFVTYFTWDPVLPIPIITATPTEMPTVGPVEKVTGSETISVIIVLETISVIVLLAIYLYWRKI